MNHCRSLIFVFNQTCRLPTLCLLLLLAGSCWLLLLLLLLLRLLLARACRLLPLLWLLQWVCRGGGVLSARHESRPWPSPQHRHHVATTARPRLWRWRGATVLRGFYSHLLLLVVLVVLLPRLLLRLLLPRRRRGLLVVVSAVQRQLQQPHELLHWELGVCGLAGKARRGGGGGGGRF